MLPCRFYPITPLFSLIALAAIGCSRSDDGPSDEPIVLGNMLEPFDPPSLEDLKAAHTWEDQPVHSGLELMRDFEKQEGPPPITVQEALALKNDSPDNNAKILATLGRVAPADRAGVNDNAEFIRHVTGDLKSTNPIFLSSTTEFEYHGLTSFNLFTFDWHLQDFANADYVASWQVSEDRMVDIVLIRDDVIWSDGTPITAHDVEFTFKVIMTEEVPGVAVRQQIEKLKTVKAYDDRTVVYFHKQPLATRIGSMNFSLIPKHKYEKSVLSDPSMAKSKTHRQLEDDPVVGGLYKLTKRKRGEELVFQRREEWYMHDGAKIRPTPYFKEVRMKVIEDPNPALLALKAGKIDEMILKPEQWQFQTIKDDYYEKNTKATDVEWTTFSIFYNCETPYFSDLRVRRAMSYAIDYDELLHQVLYGLYQPCLGIFHPDSWMFPQDAGIEPYQQDLDKAKSLLKEAGWEDTDNDGVIDKELKGRRIPFNFELVTYTTPSGIKVANLVKQSLDRVGINCTIKPTEFTVKQQVMRDHKFHAAFAGWGTGADPDTSENIWGTDAGRNYGKYSNKRVDELFEEGRRALTRDERAKAYGAIHKILWDEQPYTWLFYRNAFYGFNKKLRGYHISPRGPYDYSPGIESIYAADAVE